MPRRAVRAAIGAALLALAAMAPGLPAAAPAACAPHRGAGAASPLAAQLPVLVPRVVEWAQAESARALEAGTPLTEPMRQVAARVGVREPGRIRVLVVDEIPLPDEPALRAAAGQVGLSQSWAAGLTLGYSVMVRRGYEGELRLLSHEFRHVAQYEACGGIAGFMPLHLGHLAEVGYESSPFEADARAHETHAR